MRSKVILGNTKWPGRPFCEQNKVILGIHDMPNSLIAKVTCITCTHFLGHTQCSPFRAKDESCEYTNSSFVCHQLDGLVAIGCTWVETR